MTLQPHYPTDNRQHQQRSIRRSDRRENVTPERQNAIGLTDSSVTASAQIVDAIGVTTVDTSTETAAARPVVGKALRRRRCAQCRQWFMPTSSTQQYCSTAHRQKAYRTRHKARRRADIPATVIVTNCAHCGATFKAEGQHGRIYCGGSCKTLASRARRAATVTAMAEYLGSTQDRALEAVELYGLASARRGLEMAGFQYNQRARRWLLPVGNKVEVTM